jgi:hypothetical protein
MADHCHICDRPQGAVPYPPDDSPLCGNDDGECIERAVDWRARALAAEEALRGVLAWEVAHRHMPFDEEPCEKCADYAKARAVLGGAMTQSSRRRESEQEALLRLDAIDAWIGHYRAGTCDLDLAVDAVARLGAQAARIIGEIHPQEAPTGVPCSQEKNGAGRRSKRLPDPLATHLTGGG